MVGLFGKFQVVNGAARWRIKATKWRWPVICQLQLLWFIKYTLSSISCNSFCFWSIVDFPKQHEMMTYENSEPVFDFSISVSFLLHLCHSLVLPIYLSSFPIFSLPLPFQVSASVCLFVRQPHQPYSTSNFRFFASRTPPVCILSLPSVFQSIFYCRRSTYLAVNEPRGMICNTFIIITLSNCRNV